MIANDGSNSPYKQIGVADDLLILIAGKGGGSMKAGHHITYPNNTPMTNLFLSMLDRVGVHAETLGDSTCKLQQLF